MTIHADFWVQRLVIRGRRRELLGLGAATLVPLAKAREQALANRMLARSGGDPLSEKRRVHGVPTFAEAAQRRVQVVQPATLVGSRTRHIASQGWATAKGNNSHRPGSTRHFNRFVNFVANP